MGGGVILEPNYDVITEMRDSCLDRQTKNDDESVISVCVCVCTCSLKAC